MALGGAIVYNQEEQSIGRLKKPSDWQTWNPSIRQNYVRTLAQDICVSCSMGMCWNPISLGFTPWSESLGSAQFSAHTRRVVTSGVPAIQLGQLSGWCSPERFKSAKGNSKDAGRWNACKNVRNTSTHAHTHTYVYTYIHIRELSIDNHAYFF